MDAVKILGNILANNAMGSCSGGNILDSLLGGNGGGGNSGSGADILGALLGGGQRRGGNGGLGALGAILGAASQKGQGNSGLDLIGTLLGGLGGGSQQQSGGLGPLIGLLGGGATGRQTGDGALGNLIGGLLGGGRSSGGGLGSLLGSMTGGAGPNASSSGSDLLGALLGAAPGPMEAPPKEAHDEAEILIEAMCNAAKVDGRVDSDEQKEILKKLGDLDEDEINFVKDQLSRPLDLDAFLAKVPSDMSQQVYAFSLMAVRLDSQEEAQYFAQLAGGLGLDGDTANQIHAQLGEPEIFQ